MQLQPHGNIEYSRSRDGGLRFWVVGCFRCEFCLTPTAFLLYSVSPSTMAVDIINYRPNLQMAYLTRHLLRFGKFAVRCETEPLPANLSLNP
jgi:hypothetical protein